ncbi:hypothetical protein [Nonomuraea basaltis]|uniref:hypothetical protein n=1 Tax=Nonomuraea basaltis TaxID=2495887 RepID=UPI00110C56BA|nr:hypothetical protein [Nonomuraea basaltis]TMR97516.1 hypothetical protein EJK15_17495 [Nonomuraea basaltis]
MTEQFPAAPKYTLDTNAIIDSVRQQFHWEAVDRLVELARQGRIEMWITEAFTADQLRVTNDGHRVANLAWLAARPEIRYTRGPLRLGYAMSTLDGGVFLAGDDTAASDQEIQRILLPQHLQVGHLDETNLGHRQAQAKKIDDVHHLTTHLMQGHDVFVTRDGRMLKNRDELRRSLGLVIKTAEEAVKELGPTISA